MVFLCSLKALKVMGVLESRGRGALKRRVAVEQMAGAQGSQ